jgi:MltA-interacting protein MipA
MQIKIIRQIVFVLLLINCCTIQHIQAQQDSTAVLPLPVKPKKHLDITAEINYMRHYLWRGALFGNDDVSQPLLTFEYKHFFVNLCSNINLITKNLPIEFYSKKVMYDEQDVEAGYKNNIKKLEYEIKTMAYFYFNQINTPNTFEAGLKLSYPLVKNITACIETAADLNAYRGAVYNNTGIIWEFTNKKNDFLIGAGASFANNKFSTTYFGSEAAGLLFWSSKASVTHNFKNTYLTLVGEYNLYSNKTLKTVTERNYTANFSITLGREFSLHCKTKKS